jgi:hypothetical protein
MKAAIITAAGKAPMYGDLYEPVADEGQELITVSASALSQFSKSRSSGSHYSSSGKFPSGAGAPTESGALATGRSVYFALPETPHGALAEKSLVSLQHGVAVSDGVDDVTAAAIADPGMSARAALVERGTYNREKRSSSMGQREPLTDSRLSSQNILAQAKSLAQGRNENELAELLSRGADTVIPFPLGPIASAGREALLTAADRGVQSRY